MKAKVASLLVILLMTASQFMAQKKITVEAESYDISNNLDLQAVASVFGESKDLQDFEMKLNDYDSKISNLDLNNDGEVDYLRVIETSENNVHVVVVQAVLDRDVFQDVASIVVEKKKNRRTYVQVVGDPFLYGVNYIIEPVYVYTPSIYSFFWSPRYVSWNSPYYWGYYPTHYRYRNPYEINIYLSNVYLHVNHQHRYYYTERYRNDYAIKLHQRVSRNDFGNKYPDRNFSYRNKDLRNKQEYNNKRSGGERSIPTRPSYQGSENGRKTNNTNGASMDRTQNGSRNSSATRNSQQNTESRSSNSNANQRMTQPRTNNSGTRSMESNRSEREVNQSRPATSSSRGTNQTQSSDNTNRSSRNSGTVNRESSNTNSATRESNIRESSTRENNARNSNSNTVGRENNTRTAPAVSQPSSTRSESRSSESSRSNNTPSERGSRSSENNTNRR